MALLIFKKKNLKFLFIKKGHFNHFSGDKITWKKLILKISNHLDSVVKYNKLEVNFLFST